MPSDMGICFLSLAALDWESISEYGFGRNTMSGTFVIVNAGRERESVFTLQTKRGWIQICEEKKKIPWFLSDYSDAMSGIEVRAL